MEKTIIKDTLHRLNYAQTSNEQNNTKQIFVEQYAEARQEAWTEAEVEIYFLL